MLRKLGYALAALVALGGLFIASIYVVSESAGEIISLTTYDAANAPHTTRIWIVDDGGSQWLRSGVRGNGWYARLAAHPEVEMVRNGTTARYRAVPVDTPEARDRIHRLMAEKYGFGDRYISLLRDGSRSIAVRLDPL
jgi:hypothetical protein